MAVAGANWTVRLWRRTSLMQRLAFIALMPTLVTAALLVVMLTRYQLNTLRGMSPGFCPAAQAPTHLPLLSTSASLWPITAGSYLT